MSSTPVYNIAGKMATQVLRRYIVTVQQQHHAADDDDDNNNGSYSWCDVVSAAKQISADSHQQQQNNSSKKKAPHVPASPPPPLNAMSRAGHKSVGPITPRAPSTATTIHTESDLRRAVAMLTRTFPSLPRDTPRSEIAKATAASPRSAVAAAPTTPRQDPLDVKPVECLTPRGASMFPPLQRTAPRTSSQHLNLCSHTSADLAQTERRLAIKAPKPFLGQLDHFSRGNASSARRKRNMGLIQDVVGGGAGGSSSARHKKHLYEEQQRLAQELVDQEDENEAYGARHKPRFTAEQIEGVISSKSRYGLHFTGPQMPSQAVVGNKNKNNNNNSNGQQQQENLLLMTDALLDKLKERQQQRATRAELDRETQLRHAAQERQRLEREQERQRERRAAAEAEAEMAAERQTKLQRRADQAKLAEDLKRAERLRMERIKQAQGEKETFAAEYRKQNESETADAQLQSLKARKRREAVSRANEELAEKRRQRIRSDKERERALEKAELETRLGKA